MKYWEWPIGFVVAVLLSIGDAKGEGQFNYPSAWEHGNFSEVDSIWVNDSLVYVGKPVPVRVHFKQQRLITITPEWMNLDSILTIDSLRVNL